MILPSKACSCGKYYLTDKVSGCGLYISTLFYPASECWWGTRLDLLAIQTYKRTVQFSRLCTLYSSRHLRKERNIERTVAASHYALHADKWDWSNAPAFAPDMTSLR
jgi:hypothetical protein